MATRAKALKKFAKNVLHHDLTGMSETAVLKDLLKQEFNIDAVGNSVVSVLMNAVSNDGEEEAGRFVVKPQEPLPPAVRRGSGENCSISVPCFTPVMTFDGQPLSIEDFMSGGGTFAVEGATHVSELNIDYLPVDCDATSVTYTTTFTYQGESCVVTVTQPVSGGLG